MKIYPFGNFNYGVISKNPPEKIPDGAAYDSINWMTNRGRIELAYGSAALGTTPSGLSRVTGLKKGIRADGVEILFRTDNQSLRYYNIVSKDWSEVGTNILGSAANGEDTTMDLFENVSGKQLWVNSPHAGPFKILIANPSSYTSMYDSTKNYKAWMRIFDNQSYLWGMDAVDNNAVRLSYIETRGRADFTQVVAEVVTNGVALATKATTPKAHFFDITGTGGGEAFTEDLSGNLVGASGGTGTINYTSGVIAFTKGDATVPASLTVTYRYVDETTTYTPSGGALSGGLMNFTVPASRVSGQPNVFQQGHGGNLKTIVALGPHKFCGHTKAIYDVLPSLDDTKTTNTLFRDNIGAATIRGFYNAPEGIYGVDTTDLSNPRFVVITYSAKTTDIKPANISPNLDLTGYSFDQLAVFPFSDYIIYSVRTNDSPRNNRLFLYHRVYRYWDVKDDNASCGEIYNNTLVVGDSISSGVNTLFSGFDNNGDVIYNYWTSGISKLGYITPRGTIRKINGMKKAKKVLIAGYIAPAQILHLYASTDRGNFAEVLDKTGGPIILGTGSYVDKSQSVTIGSHMIGDKTLGGGGTGVEVYYYERYLDFSRGKFEEIQIMFQATGIGYLSINRFDFRDIRVLQDKAARKYRSP